MHASVFLFPRGIDKMPVITKIIQIDNDASIREDHPNTNYGTLPEANAVILDSSLERRGLFSGPIPPIPGAPATLISAKLYVWNRFAGGFKDGVPVGQGFDYLDCYETASFDEAVVTWNTKPALSGLADRIPYSDFVAHGESWHWLEFDVEAEVFAKGWGTDIFFQLLLAWTLQPDLWVWMRTKEYIDVAGKQPYIEIQYLDDLPIAVVASVVPQALDKEKNTVNWTLNADTDFQKYEIWRRIDDGSWEPVHTELVQAVVTWDDPLIIDDGSQIEYYVSVYDLSDQENPSSIVSMIKPRIDDFSINNLAPDVLETVTGTIAAAGDTIVDWWYDWGDGTQEWIPASSRDHQYAASGIYNTQCRAENSGGWRSSIVAGPVVNVESQDPIADLKIQPTNAFTDEEVVFNGMESFDSDLLDGGIDVYEFDPGTGTFDINNGDNPKYIHVFTAPGTYVCRLRVTDNDLNQAIDEYTVYVTDAIISELILNFPAARLDRDRPINYVIDEFFHGIGTSMDKVSTGSLVLLIGATCWCQDGQADIDQLEVIRDDPDGQKRYKILIGDKYYTGYFMDLTIEKLKGGNDIAWQWNARFRITINPGAI